MRISHKYKFIFLANPRTASGAIRKILDEYSDIKSVHISDITKEFPFYDHISALELKKVFDEKGWDWFSYRRFCVVRNPFDRVVSLYHHKLKNVKNWDSRMSFFFNITRKLKYFIIPDFNFEKFVSMLDPKKRLTSSLKEFITDEKGNFLIYDILVYENLYKEIKFYLEGLGIKIQDGNLPTLNRSDGRRHYREYYSKKTEEIILGIYKYEIERFGYKF